MVVFDKNGTKSYLRVQHKHQLSGRLPHFSNVTHIHKILPRNFPNIYDNSPEFLIILQLFDCLTFSLFLFLPSFLPFKTLFESKIYTE